MAEKAASDNKKPLLRAYLFAGSDSMKRKSFLKRLMTRIGEECELSLNMESFDASQLKETSMVIDACNTLPFASPLRLVIVKNMEKASKPLTDELVAYLSHPCESTVLVLEAEKLAKNARLITAIKKIDENAYIDCKEVKSGELPSLVQKMARVNGVDMPIDAARRLIERVGTSTTALDGEIKKLVAYVTALARKSISKNDIDLVVARSAVINSWEFSDAFAHRQTARALELARELKRSGSSSDGNPVSLLAMCTIRLRELIKIKSLQERSSTSEDAIAKSLGKRESWQVRYLINASRTRSSAKLRELLIKAAQTDMKMKSGYDADLLLTQFLLDS